MSGRRKVAILGAGGAVGRGLLDWFSRHTEFDVLGVCRRSEQADELRALGYQVEAKALGDVDLPDCLASRDFVINAIRPSGPIPEWRATEDSIAAMLERLPQRVGGIQLSSVSVYAQFYRDPSREFSRPSGRGTYARNKRWMEHRLLKSWQTRPRPLVIARVGHVWGVGQGWTKTILDRLSKPRARLLLDGAAFSNAVHVYTLGSALQLAMSDERRTVLANVVHDPQWTWRTLFDYHADAVGTPRIASADADFGERYLRTRRYPYDHSLHARMFSEAWRWFRGLAASFSSSCPSMREAASRVLVAVGAERLDERLRESEVPASLRQSADSPPIVDYWMIGDPVPGPILPSAFCPSLKTVALE